ncbi:hypothetical protein [Cupriavidus gilardii]|uniref:Phage neck terminator protein gp12-like domain-containing protein n=1 Tax=Cupriavidus gilardii TaxID=82541 RepID=A0ABY4VNR4_9BURK|nr:hypothetical protein [Cupriavidus gilardii]USE78838.1 hypothetical protein NDR89_19560 [Cupriavidus gilardii]WNG67724.1 hypothetical protein QWJ31_07970 [Cupriavidus gilardii]
MANDSSTGGYLSPAVASPPLEDDALDDLLHDLVAGVTGLPGDMVRPRWQPTVPKQPEPSVNWCAIGVTVQTNDASPAIQHDPTGDGSDVYQRHQDIELLCTFYGPAAKGYAQMLVDGLAIPQNSEQLGLNDMKFVSAGTIRAAPDLVNQQWVRRYDVTVALRRKITRTYPVLNLLSAQVKTETDSVPPMDGTIDIHQ